MSICVAIIFLDYSISVIIIALFNVINLNIVYTNQPVLSLKVLVFIEKNSVIIIIIIIILYHDFLPTPRRGSHVKSGKTHTVIKIHPLAHILDS